MSQGQWKRWAGVLVVASLLMACGRNHGGDSPAAGITTSPTGQPGLGADTGQPNGTPVELPGTITIVRAVGADHTDSSLQTPVCEGVEAERVPFNQGSGAVDLCLTVRGDPAADANATAPIQLTLPAGALFVALDSSDPSVPKSQNGLLAQAVTLSVSPGATKIYLLRLFCVNRPAPSSDRPAFPGDVTTNWEYATTITRIDYAPLQEITAILADRLIDWSATEIVQEAVWDVTEDGDGLSAQNRANLQALPPRP